MKRNPGVRLPLALLVLLLAATHTSGAAIEAIEEASTDAERLITELNQQGQISDKGSVKIAEAIARLEQAKEAAENVSERLQSKLEEYKRTQTLLTSGLIGALVTAVVAIIGAVSRVRNSRPERDLKRLEVVEKARELAASGVKVPADISAHYLGVVTPPSRIEPEPRRQLEQQFPAS